jgi:hypothetical protein
MDWSSGSYTDPPFNVLAARYAVEEGAGGGIVAPGQWVYPAMHWIARAAYEALGARRLATVVAAALLGCVLVALLAILARRIAGDDAGCIAAVLAAVSAWFVPNSRILMAESVAVTLVVAAALAAVSRHPRGPLIAGAVAACAGLFGKYHALAFFPALLLFLAGRDGWRGVLASIAGASVVAALWLAVVFVPHSAEVLGFFGETSLGMTAFADRGILRGALTPFAALQQSWLSLRMPIVFPVGAWFVLRTLGRRPFDGRSLIALWALCSFTATALLPYRPPRYFTFVAAALLAGAACRMADWLRSPDDDGASRVGRVRRLLFAAICSFAALEITAHGESALTLRFFLDAWVLDSSRSDTFSTLQQRLGGLPGEVLLSLGVAGVSFLLWRLLRLSRVESASFARAMGCSVLAAALAIDAARWVDWATHRTTTVEAAKASLAAIVAPGAVLRGGFAPLLTEGSGLPAHPHFATISAADLRLDPPITHLLLVPADVSALARAMPELETRLHLVQRWPIRTAWAKSISLFRLPEPEIPPSYRPSAFEEAVLALESGRWEEAREYLAAHRAIGAPSADADLAEGILLRTAADFDGARDAFTRAAAARPDDPLPVAQLAHLAGSRGDAAEAARLWLRVVALDPGFPDAIERADTWLTRARSAP